MGVANPMSSSRSSLITMIRNSIGRRISSPLRVADFKNLNMTGTFDNLSMRSGARAIGTHLV